MSVTHEAVGDLVHKHGISTCTISDVLDGLAVPGAVLDSRLQRMSGGTDMFFGAAVPVSWVTVRKGPQITAAAPSTWAQVRNFLVPDVTDGRGHIYVAGAGDLVTEAALAGGLSVTYLCESLGFEGVVLGGAIRDRALVEASGCPLVASSFVPTDTQGAFRVQSAGESCVINNVVVRTSDWIFSDGNGTVVVPSSLVADVLQKAAAIEETEQQVLKRLRSGHRLPAIIDDVGRI
jgi:regulator of RNase E activity RraA